MKILKTLDKYLGRLFLIMVTRPAQGELTTALTRNKKVLFIRPGGIGDAVLLIPAILGLSNKYPDVSIDILSEKRNWQIFSLCPGIKNVYLYDKLPHLLSLIRNDYDVVVDTEQWHRLSAVVARLINPKISVGYATNDRGKLFTHPVPYSHNEYEIYSFFNLLKPLIDEIPFDTEIPFLDISSKLTNEVKSLLRPLSRKKIVALFPGGSIKERQWGSNKFHEVARLLIDEGYGVAIVGGKEDVPQGCEISDGLPKIINLCGKLTLGETAAVLKGCSLLITGDSGIMHLGYGLGLKIVALFGPGIQKKWAPQSRCIVINKDLSCSPCTEFGYTPRCKKDAECMKQITVQEVYESAVSLLECYE